MSFCFDTKQEICNVSEKNKFLLFYGMIMFSEKISADCLQITSENVFVINILDQLADELFGVHFLVDESTNAYIATLSSDSLKRVFNEYHIDSDAVQVHLQADLIRSSEDLASFLRGAFLVGGSVTNPNSAYHLELVTHYYQFSKECKALLEAYGFKFKTVMRKSHYVLYLKDSDVIERFLYILGAQTAAFTLINVKIYKQIQNDNNRLNNCEGYNRDKTMNKSIEQILAINKIEKNKGLEMLGEDLGEVARLRLQNQYASLSELAALSNGKFSKAGLSRRLSKIIEISKQIDG